jgi:hypothetical protein
MILSLVSGTFNRLAHLQRMVASFRATVPRGTTYECVIVDGGSTDGTLSWCQEQPDIRLIEHGELRGAIAAFCDGARAAQGKYVLLSNDDVVFRPGSVLPALVHLEENLACGAVAFADDRPVQGKQGHSAMFMAATQKGAFRTVPYVQVGLVRKWLGDVVGWWGAEDTQFPASTYAGDNYMSAKIWAAGYSIDTVPDCVVDDLIVNDDLRAINYGNEGKRGEADSAAYYRLWPTGPELNVETPLAQQDTLSLRILYLPIYEPGRAVQQRQKRGLRQALSRLAFTDREAIVYELDYLAVAETKLLSQLQDIITTFQPHLMLTQLHGAKPITPDMLAAIRALLPQMVVYNWNGDYWPRNLTNPEMLRLLRYVDLQMTVNATVLETYRQQNIHAAYWQIGYEEALGEVPEMPTFDVVFLGNQYSPLRQALEEALRALQSENITVGLYGEGWQDAQGDCLYDFTTGVGIYKAAKLSIGDNQFPDAYGFVSNRIFQALAAGGALLLHQEVPGLEELTGLVAGQHYILWTDFSDLQNKIRYWLAPERRAKRRLIARQGTQFARDQHSFDARVREFFTDLVPQARRTPAHRVGLRYLGPRRDSFGVMGKYVHQPGEVLLVDPTDVPAIIGGGLFIEIGVQTGDRVAEAYGR